MLRAGVNGEGHRRSSRERGRSGSEATMGAWSTEATSVSAGAWEMEEDRVAMAGSSKGDAKPDVDLDKLTNSLSSLKMVPQSITFGRRKRPLGFAKS